jgi:hypothetical protein
MLSVVQDKDHPDALVVRARLEGDIESVIPIAKGNVIHTTNSDYPYRVFITKKAFADIMHARIMGIRYTNFKDNVRTRHRKDSFSQVWSLLLDGYQKVQSLYKRSDRRFDV